MLKSNIKEVAAPNTALRRLRLVLTNGKLLITSHDHQHTPMDVPISLIISSNTTLWITTTSSHLHQNKRSIKPDLQLSAFGVPGVYMYLHSPARFGGIYPSFLVNLFIIGLGR
jgi:hypothetical protein